MAEKEQAVRLNPASGSPTQTISKEAKPAARRRAAPRTAEDTGRGPSKIVMLLLALVCLVGGIAIGAFIMRQRYNARQVVLAVNGAVITKDDFVRRMERNNGVASLQQLVAEELQMQFARKMGAAPTDAEVNARYAEAAKNPDFLRGLAAVRISPEEFKRNLRLNMAKAAVVNKDVTVTEAEIKKFYQDNIDKKNPDARFYTPETAQIAVIVTTTQAEANKALSELREGRSWSEVVSKYSDDRSKSNEGVLPPFQRGRTKARNVPGLEETIFSMKIGSQLGPKRFQNAWWIIRCLDRKPEVTQPFEKVKEEARTGAMLMKGLPSKAKQIESDFADFQRKANIQIFWPQYRGAINLK